MTQTEQLRALQAQPEFRKATTNMARAYLAAEEAIAHLPTTARAALGIVVGTNHGEFHATREFLKTLADTGAARPLLFQNSLHNSTLGFLAVRLGIAGPGLTVSNGGATRAQTFATARTLLDGGLCASVLVILADEDAPDCVTGTAEAVLLERDGGAT